MNAIITILNYTEAIPGRDNPPLGYMEGLIQNELLEQFYFMIDFNYCNKNLLALYVSECPEGPWLEVPFGIIHDIYSTFNWLKNDFYTFYNDGFSSTLPF